MNAVNAIITARKISRTAYVVAVHRTMPNHDISGMYNIVLI